ncbi:MmcQ/YjbR family DNA-binding protein [Streptomyces sp. NPDC017890]|uniref:MmcQ/YjbR family DNA-binding protein n=1 Tax=Streptomyces sp. NPDC017890 TaxID=3365015 RepID=UPI0037AC4B0E
MTALEDVRRLALALPRTEEHLIRDRVKFRIGRIVYLALSRDETTLGFAFPKEERAALVASDPVKFSLPRTSDLRYDWAQASLAALDLPELTELVTEAWRMCVPARLARAHLGPDPEPPVPPAPPLARLRASAEVFAAYRGVDRAWLRLRELTATGPGQGPGAAHESGPGQGPGAAHESGPGHEPDPVPDTGPDLTRPAHRTALHRWLNAWGCRLPYPREGDPDLLGDGLAAWSARHPLPGTPLHGLTDSAIDAIGAAYAELAALPVKAPPRPRTLGPTAAAKALYALRPHTVMPWDAAIATELYGARDAAAFARHLRTGRAWARAALAESGLAHDALAAELGRPAVTLPKVLDEHLYVTITRGAAP